MSRETIRVPHGGCGEFAAWDLVFDCYVSDYVNGPRCQHAKPGRNGGFTVPRAVMSATQGGYDCTAVCLDCILETAASIG